MSTLTPPQTLNDFMEFDRVICVEEDGRVHDDVTGVYAPEFTVGTNENEQILDEHEQQMIAEVKTQGWELLSGWTGQYSYSGPIMHGSEFIGGDLENHIRETPGLYAVVAVDYEGSDGAICSAGWAIAYREKAE